LYPEAWKIEHNKLHHCYLGEEKDPDRPGYVFTDLFDTFGIKNRSLKILSLINCMMCWRFLQYPINSYDKYFSSKNKSIDEKIYFPIRVPSMVSIKNCFRKEFILGILTKVYLPYIFFTYFVVPILYGIILNSMHIVNVVLVNIFISEILTNIITFVLIVPNHAGDDLYEFKTRCKNNKEHIYRSAIGSTNYSYGDEITDFFHGYLNYQIEHHMFPELSPLEYRLLAPEIKKVCEKHNVQYVQQNIFKRFRKLVRVILGDEQNKLI
jgi:fatty acid desaturase